MTNPLGFAPTLFTFHYSLKKDEASASSFLFEGIGKNVRNESTESQPPSETAVEACPTAYIGTPSGEGGS